ncbi:DEAD/DEAH box helicase family protein [Vineibacter terrae]|uniref:hypothetical protein n=1 Tax=Vineibacter terrae TaxID=2586908 RepID=UPI001C499CE7|nr:hypothetical protein [Vineibacter terrae]
MAVLEDLKPNCSVRGVLPNGIVTVVSVQWFGSGAIELTYKDAAGKVGNELLYRDREADLEVVEEGRPWSFEGDGVLFRLVSEAQRIYLAHLFDLVLAVHTSVVEPLPHQITAAYESRLSWKHSISDQLRPVVKCDTCQEKDAERNAVAANQSDILLTNYMMLELLLTRQDELDARVMGNARGLK